MRLDKNAIKVSSPFTLQVSDPNTFKLLLPVSAVILPSYELVITILFLDIYWNLLWHSQRYLQSLLYQLSLAAHLWSDTAALCQQGSDESLSEIRKQKY